MAAVATEMAQLTNTERYAIIKNKVSGNHTITDLKVIPITSNGYLGEYFSIEITLLIDEEKQCGTKTHRFFMKMPPTHGWQMTLMEEGGLFEKEMIFYRDLSGMFRKFISTDVYPECFLAVPGKIVLADLSMLGFRPLKDLQQTLDYQHAKQGIMALARLHVTTIIYEEKNKRKLNEDFPETAKEAVYVRDTIAIDFLESGGRAIAAMAPYLTKYRNDPKVVAKIQEYVIPLMDKMVFYLNADTPFRRVMCHGDTWPANFMFKYDDHGNPSKAMIIDFQMTKYRSPAVDIASYMYLSIATNDLKKWRDDLLEVYYEVMKKEMKKNDLDASKIYTYEEFKEAYIFHQLFGIIYGLLFFPFSRVNQESMKKIAEDKEKAMKFYYKDRSENLVEGYKTDSRLRKCLDDILEELYENFIKTNRGETELTQ